MPILFTLLTSAAASADIYYFTDLEGSRARIEATYRECGAFVRGDGGRAHVRPGVTVVYGGDATDRYPGSLFVLEELVRHHEENPSTFVSIAGNRDTNKLRLVSELSPMAVRRPPSYREYTAPDAYAEEAAATPDRARRLKFMLRHNMGSPEAFEMWRNELAERWGRTGVTDEEVVDAYAALLAPGGLQARLLGHMRLAARFGNTLFVHGGLTPENIRPGEDVDAWLRERDAWYRGQVNEGVSKYLRWTGEGPRPAEALLDYAMPRPGAPSKPESLITGRHVDRQNNPLPPDDGVVRYLRDRGVAREVVGHTPIGETSVIVRDAAGEFESIFADISYSSDQTKPNWVRLIGPEYRTAIAEGWAQIDGGWRKVRAETTLGRPTPIGRRLRDGSRVIGRLQDGRYVATRMENFKILNRALAPCAVDLAELETQ